MLDNGVSKEFVVITPQLFGAFIAQAAAKRSRPDHVGDYDASNSNRGLSLHQPSLRR